MIRVRSCAAAVAGAFFQSGRFLQPPRLGPGSIQNHRSLKTHTLTVSGERKIAYRQMPGSRQPTIVVVPGLHSYAHMNGMTAKSILMYCDVNDYSCVVYDSEGTGESSNLEGANGGRDVIFSHWIEDAVTVVEKLTEGPVIVASCSMGGWLSLVAAQRLKERIHGMLLYAPALNYAYPYYKKHKELLPASVQERLESGDVHVLAHTYGDALLKKDFAEDSLKYEIDVAKPYELDCPIRILHGLRDCEVDPDQSRRLCEAMTSEDVDLIYRKSGLHQLDSPPDVELFINSLDRMVKDFPVR